MKLFDKFDLSEEIESEVLNDSLNKSEKDFIENQEEKLGSLPSLELDREIDRVRNSEKDFKRRLVNS